MQWNVDSAQSYVRLSIPDQNISAGSLGTVTNRARDAGNSATWTDYGGRRAFLGGLISSDFVHGSSIAFNGGQQDLYALESGVFRPNPNAFIVAFTPIPKPSSIVIAGLGVLGLCCVGRRRVRRTK